MKAAIARGAWLDKSQYAWFERQLEKAGKYSSGKLAPHMAKNAEEELRILEEELPAGWRDGFDLGVRFRTFTITSLLIVC